MTLAFQFTAPDTICTYENGTRVIDETLDTSTYQVYVDEARRVTRPDIELIPGPYFSLLAAADPHVTAIPFSDEAWDVTCGSLLPASIRDALMPFQKSAVYRMVKSRRCMNASDMGLGKSVQGLAATVCLRNPKRGDLILCPGSLRKNWVAEVKKWLGDDYPVHLIDRGGKRHLESSIKAMLFAPGIKIVSYDMAATFFKALSPVARRRPYFNTILCDESHSLKNPDSKRYMYLRDVIQNSSHLFLLSGTPAPNRSNELFTQFALIAPGTFTSRRAFTDRYSNGHVDQFGRYDDRGASNIDELAFMTRKLVLRLRREDYLAELPGVTRQRVILSPRGYPADFKAQMAKFREQLQLVDSDEHASTNLQRLAGQMFTETAKIKEAPVIEFMDSFCDGNSAKTVLFCVHLNMLTAVSKFLERRGEGFVCISGATPMQQRMDLIRTFLDDPACKYALCTLGSCSTGLNFTPAPQMIFLELSYDFAGILQATCRINRIGGAANLSYWFLICEETLDEMVFNKLSIKNAHSIAVIEGGTDYGDLKFDQEDNRQFKKKKV